uniref:Uncharacterized protein n=1 Tax=Eucampia antarctica TaxID=49252 RepID=A0A7S2SGC9_9STRA|mmetsp:Transcript_7883/g.7476  ORF Transcript_7883/g.7476 Transcript_7883/m.7476 type:complete len:800 (+) Transcript_7883:155-2554(+)|eukprot:CAMPEP_0197825968 /NCGR_PEP_ID=MMETSP1437-20131217/2990_1 /TAXON_ID=49252 ORGANISM="Eucampia antarctica, Strain CCMP1452" /NCGR_SAMPLE_ID=MMETSP1437 /ASSEMBLY_ACC=CAM_ASM_001096 /LENGTH=799 /DNA_ID=CAMNT_0043426203 /DNA_START=143 /DNA_END=2542 /DNA_ORIENTATION=-
MTQTVQHYSDEDFESVMDASESEVPLTGTILEAAFVDPAYSWPPAEGQGQHAIELQASTVLLKKVDPNDASADYDDEDYDEDYDEEDLRDPEPPRIKRKNTVVTTTETTVTSRCGFFRCCKSEDAVVNTHTEREPIDPEEKERLKQEYLAKKADVAMKREKRSEKRSNTLKLKKARKREARQDKFDREKYTTVPEGILIYQLDTASHAISLLSVPNSNTNLDTLVRTMVIAYAEPSRDKSRRGIQLTSIDGTKATLVACEQRTAIAWLEILDMMLGNRGAGRRNMGKSNVDPETLIMRQESQAWSAQNLNDKERDNIEEQYLNLTTYSNNLIRAGAIPGANKDKKKSSSGGIYYSVTSHKEEGDDYDEEALESIAKRRAVIKDSWDFYRMICSLLRDRRKYDEVFRRLQMDPVYPYLNSMTGLNDSGDDGRETVEKTVMQEDLKAYSKMTRSDVCKDLVKRAEDALPSLVDICKALAGSLGMEEVGVGPLKDVSAAIRKAEKKYEGDVLKVTDYCRALLVVKDFPTLLALLELARDSFGPLIRRVKLSTLKNDHKSLPGGYRDCKINLELKDHVCEIQIHVWPMWVICGIDGFRHYRHCLEYATDTFADAYDALSGLDKKTLAELIVMSEEAVADMPLDNLEWYHEKFILDYFAEVGLFLRHGNTVWAEVTLNQLIWLRSESPDIGPDHEETLYLKKYLLQAYKEDGKEKEAAFLENEIESLETDRKSKKIEEEKSLWESMFVEPKEAFDLLMDPNKKEREEEERIRKEVKLSKKAWRKIREEKFKFLDNHEEDADPFN